MSEYRISAMFAICVFLLPGGCQISREIQEVEPPSDQPPLTELGSVSSERKLASELTGQIAPTDTGESQ